MKGYKYFFNFTRRGTMCEDSSSFDFLVFATLLLLVLGFVNPKFPIYFDDSSFFPCTNKKNVEMYTKCLDSMHS